MLETTSCIALTDLLFFPEFGGVKLFNMATFFVARHVALPCKRDLYSVSVCSASGSLLWEWLFIRD